MRVILGDLRHNLARKTMGHMLPDLTHCCGWGNHDEFRTLTRLYVFGQIIQNSAQKFQFDGGVQICRFGGGFIQAESIVHATGAIMSQFMCALGMSRIPNSP